MSEKTRILTRGRRAPRGNSAQMLTDYHHNHLFQIVCCWWSNADTRVCVCLILLAKFKVKSFQLVLTSSNVRVWEQRLASQPVGIGMDVWVAEHKFPKLNGSNTPSQTPGTNLVEKVLEAAVQLVLLVRRNPYVTRQLVPQQRNSAKTPD